MASPVRDSKTLQLVNVFLSLGVIALGYAVWRHPDYLHFPSRQSWFGFVLMIYGLLRGLMFYQRWQSMKPQ